MLIEAVSKSFSVMEVLEKLNLRRAGGTHYHYSNRIKKLGIKTEHFLGKRNKLGKHSTLKHSPESILKLRSDGGRTKTYKLKRALLESGVLYKCSRCNQPPLWMGFELTLDIDHINEDWLDDRKENLRFLCPNCHTQFSRGKIPKEDISEETVRTWNAIFDEKNKHLFSKEAALKAFKCVIIEE